MLEARFVSLNPMMQILFLKLKEEKNVEKREFILETLLKEFHDVAKEAKKVFERFDMLGSCVDVLGTSDKTKPREEFKIPIPFKLVGMHEALKRILIGLFLKILLMKVVNQREMRRDPPKLIWMRYLL